MKIILLLIISSLLASCSLTKVKLTKIERERNPLQVVWSKNLDVSHSSGNLPISFNSPLIHQDFLFIGDLDGKFYCYELSTGKEVWSAKEISSIYSKAEIYKENVIYSTQSGRIISRNIYSGKLLWAFDLGQPIESPVTVVGENFYVHARNHKLIAVNADYGKVLWSYQRSVPFKVTVQNQSGILPYKNLLVTGFADGYVVAFDAIEGVVKWEVDISTAIKFIDVDITPIVFNNNIVASAKQGRLTFLNPKNGVIKKTVPIVPGHRPLKVGANLLIGTDSGSIVKVNSEGTIIFNKKITNEQITSIKKWGNSYVLTTTGKEIFNLDNKTFETTKSVNLGSVYSNVFGEIATDGEFLSIYSSRNRLYVFKNI